MDRREVLWRDIRQPVPLEALPTDLTVDRKRMEIIDLQVLERDCELLKTTTVKWLIENPKFSSLSKMVMTDNYSVI